MLETIVQTLSWSDLGLLIILVFLEAILSADNAIALAALVKHLPPIEQKQALRWGMLGAYGFRMGHVNSRFRVTPLGIFKTSMFFWSTRN
jgi:predicted tellurium resistance membrane protein TerC